MNGTFTTAIGTSEPGWLKKLTAARNEIRIAPLVLTASLALSGCEAPSYMPTSNPSAGVAEIMQKDKDNESKYTNGIIEDSRRVDDAMSAYRKDKACEGKTFQDAVAADDAVLEATNAPIYFKNRNDLMLIYRKLSAGFYNHLAAAAADKKCCAAARKVYLSVIETFTGSAYEAERQRAQIGIDDLRGRQ